MTALNESISLKSTCCVRGKDDPLNPLELDATSEAKARRGVRKVSFNTKTVRSAPYTSKIDIEGRISTLSMILSDKDPEICLVTTFEPACKHSDPEPLKSWTNHEQQVLIDSLNEHPQAREDESYRRKLMDRVRKDLPNKSLEEIRECYAYLLKVRIALARCSRFAAIHAASPRGGQRVQT